MIARSTNYKDDYPDGYTPHFDGGDHPWLVRNHGHRISFSFLRADYHSPALFRVIDDMSYDKMYGGAFIGSLHGNTGFQRINRTTFRESKDGQGMDMNWEDSDYLINEVPFI